MNLCSDQHDEICYAGRDCPACERNNDIKSLNETIGELREENKLAADAITSLESDVEKWVSEVRALEKPNEFV